jgi:WD40 repeat protein/calcineurin-like phosphoesterase family protein
VTSPRLAGALAAVLVLCGLAAPAAGAFAGRNGILVYEGRTSAKRFLTLRAPDGSGSRFLRTSARPSRPSFSPQGRRIAYAAAGQIWVMQADGSAHRAVTATYYPGNADPAWSPGGDALVFSGGPAGARDVFTIGADGEGLRRLTAKAVDEGSPAWSARGRIAFVRRTSGGDGDIWSMSATGGAAVRVTRGAADDREPAWSPDGRRIAFTRDAKRRRDVYVADERGRHVRRVRGLPAPASTPVWSPDGRWIAFAMGRGERRAIYRMRSNGKRLTRIASPVAGAKALDWQVRAGDPVVAGAGDIACDPSSPAYGDGYGTDTACHERATSNSLMRMDLSAVLMLGDAQYEDATATKFAASFAPSWGRLKDLMRPVVGNHEYNDPGATAYFDYFNGAGRPTGPAGARGAGWYSFDVGTWHVVALNSNCAIVSCAAGAPQEQWLRADLAAHPALCTLALMHHPFVSSGSSDEGATPEVQPLWQALYDAGADVVLSGHDHAYERFALIAPTGVADPARGLREFVVGTGGKSLQGTASLRATSEVRSTTTFGVIALGLHARSYDWQFVPDTPGGFTDRGSASCH